MFHDVGSLHTQSRVPFRGPFRRSQQKGTTIRGLRNENSVLGYISSIAVHKGPKQ